MRFAFVTDELPVQGVAGHLAFNAAIIEWLVASGHEVVILLLRPRFRLPVVRYGMVQVVGPEVIGWRGYLVSVQPAEVARIMARYLAGGLAVALGNFLRRRGRAPKHGMVDAV